MVGLSVPQHYEVTVFMSSGEQFTFASRGDVVWRQWLPVIATAAAAYMQTVVLVHADLNLVLLDEPIGVTGVVSFAWPREEIEIVAVVTRLRFWYDDFLLKAMFDLWLHCVDNPWAELS
jgi:hypothetical protein